MQPRKLKAKEKLGNHFVKGIYSKNNAPYSSNGELFGPQGASLSDTDMRAGASLCRRAHTCKILASGLLGHHKQSSLNDCLWDRLLRLSFLSRGSQGGPRARGSYWRSHSTNWLNRRPGTTSDRGGVLDALKFPSQGPQQGLHSHAYRRAMGAHKMSF